MSLFRNGNGELTGILPRLRDRVRELEPRQAKGRVRRLLGVVVHATVTEVRVGEICELVDPTTKRSVMAEVIGLADDMAVLTPIGELSGLSSLTEVVPTGQDLRIPVGPGLLGRTISALGTPLDTLPWPPQGIEDYYPVGAVPPAPLERELIREPIQLGLRAIDGLITLGRGQRVGVFGEAGIGKSTVLAEIARNTDAEVVVVGLIGERGREVREFIDLQLGPEGMKKCVLVVSTSERPAMERVKAAYVATTIAEYFRDQGKHVLLLMDSITRFARAQREIGLAAGEPPTRRGFPPSLFAQLPRLLERSGPGKCGSITGVYTILVEGDNTLDPVAEETQSILDGHIILSADLAHRDHFPAIDVLKSRSRLMDLVVTPEHRQAAGRLRELMARYNEVELLLRVGEYKIGSDPATDEAINKIGNINTLLRQAKGERDTIAGVTQRMREIAG